MSFALCAVGGLATLAIPAYGKGSFVVSVGRIGLMEMVCNLGQRPKKQRQLEEAG